MSGFLSSLSDPKNLQAIVVSVATVVGGLWILWKLFRRREEALKIELNLEAAFVLLRGDAWLVEFVAIVENKGAIRQRIRNFELKLRALGAGGLDYGDERVNFQVVFSDALKKTHWFPRGPDGWQYAFIEPGVKQRFTYAAMVPKTAEAVMLWARFEYPRLAEGHHTAMRLFRVPTEMAPYIQAAPSAAPPPAPAPRVS